MANNAATQPLRQQDIYSFLPAAIELEQTPPVPLARTFLWTILALFIITIVWACVGQVDIIASAQGKVIPSARVKQIQALESAKVSNILVADGSRVHQGDVLIQLEDTAAASDAARYAAQLQNAEAQLWRLTAYTHWLEQGRSAPVTTFLLPAAPANADQRQQYLQLQQQADELLANISKGEQERLRLQAQQRVAEAEMLKNQRLQGVIGERVTALKTLQNKQLGSRAQYLELMQDLIEVEENVRVQQATRDQLSAAISANQATSDALVHESYKTALNDLQQQATQRDSLLQEKRKAEQRLSQFTLTSPIDGSVQDLAIHTIGGVVTPAQVLMQIVPDDGPIEVEAWIENQDIGFVHSGQHVELKINAFNFTKYGVLTGKVAALSEDATQDRQDKQRYRALITLDRDTMDVDGKPVRLSPGMAVSAEIETGKRRVIEFFLSPLLRYKDESLKER